MRLLLTIAAATAVGLFVVPAEAAGFANAVLSAEKDSGTAQSNFPANTPVIYLATDLVDVALNVQSHLHLDLGRLSRRGAGQLCHRQSRSRRRRDNQARTPQLSEPTAGWPLGTYKVDMAIDGVVADSVPFSIP